jgi:quinol monooxygenase YgiN
MQIATLRIKVPRGQRQNFLDAARRVVGPTAVQSGCISCRLYQDLNDPDAVILVEEWETREEFDNHLKSREYRIVLSLVDMSTEPPEFKICAISQTEGLEALEAVRRSS